MHGGTRRSSTMANYADLTTAPTWHGWRRSWTEYAISVTRLASIGYGMPSPPRRHGAKMPRFGPHPLKNLVLPYPMPPEAGLVR
jgi:hypothetical protein